MESTALVTAFSVMVAALALTYGRSLIARRVATDPKLAARLSAQLVVVAMFTATAVVSMAMAIMLSSAVEQGQPMWVTVGFPLGISIILLVGAIMARFFTEQLGEAIYTAFNGSRHPEETPQMYASASARWWWIYAIAAIGPLIVLIENVMR